MSFLTFSITLFVVFLRTRSISKPWSSLFIRSWLYRYHHSQMYGSWLHTQHNEVEIDHAKCNDGHHDEQDERSFADKLDSHGWQFVFLLDCDLTQSRQSRTSSLRSLLRMLAWRNEQISKDPFEGRFWLVAGKQCKWPEVNQRPNMADGTPKKKK